MEGTSPTQSALHNCGPSPREVFRCAAIGSTDTVDLSRVLSTWQDMPWAESRRIVSTRVAALHTPPRHADLCFAEPAFGRVCACVLECLDAPRPGDANSGTLVRGIVTLVLDRGWHRDMIGLARHTSREVGRWRASPPTGTLEAPAYARDVALAIAAHAVYTPPLLLWTRVASMDWLRCDIALIVRRPWEGGSR
jgi:hypothetical protein